MTDEQAGKFIKILHLYHIEGRLPDMDFGMKMALTPFINQFKRDEEKYLSTCERNRLNGIKGGRNRKNPVGSSGTQSGRSEPKKADSDSDSDSDNKNDSDNESELLFNQFWDAYDKKIDVSACKKKWNNLTLDDKKKILEHVARYRESQPDKKYRKNPETYLNRRSWENEIIPLNAPEKPAAVFYQGKTMG